MTKSVSTPLVQSAQPETGNTILEGLNHSNSTGQVGALTDLHSQIFSPDYGTLQKIKASFVSVAFAAYDGTKAVCTAAKAIFASTPAVPVAAQHPEIPTDAVRFQSVPGREDLPYRHYDAEVFKLQPRYPLPQIFPDKASSPDMKSSSDKENKDMLPHVGGYQTQPVPKTQYGDDSAFEGDYSWDAMLDLQRALEALART